MPKYIMMIGQPGSGKSTIAKSLFSFDRYLSTDDLVERYAHLNGGTYDSCWADYIKEATKMFDAALTDALDNGESIVHDQTNLTSKKRAALLRRIPNRYTKIGVVVYTDDVTRANRLANRPGKTIPKSVLDSMVVTYSPPSIEEGFDQIYYINN